MPSDKGEIVLGVDLDGVCADFYSRMREIAAEWLEVGLETLTTDVSYGLTEWGIRDEDHYRQLHRFAVTQRDLFETCAPIKGAATTLRRLLPSTRGVTRVFVQPRDQVYYRVFSDRVTGSWLTAVRPPSSAWAREALALPPGNQATFVQEVVVPAGTRLERSRAAAMPQWGRARGGAEQFRLLDYVPETSFLPGVPLP